MELCRQLNPLGVSLAKVLLRYLKNFCAKTVQETKVFLFEQRQLDVVGFFIPSAGGGFRRFACILRSCSNHRGIARP